MGKKDVPVQPLLPLSARGPHRRWKLGGDYVMPDPIVIGEAARQSSPGGTQDTRRNQTMIRTIPARHPPTLHRSRVVAVARKWRSVGERRTQGQEHPPTNIPRHVPR